MFESRCFLLWLNSLSDFDREKFCERYARYSKLNLCLIFYNHAKPTKNINLLRSQELWSQRRYWYCKWFPVWTDSEKIGTLAKFEVIDHFFMFSIFQKFKPTFVLLGQFTWFLMAENGKHLASSHLVTLITNPINKNIRRQNVLKDLAMNLLTLILNWKDICGKPVKTTNTRILDRTLVVCRVDASDIRDPRFETSHWQCCSLSTVQKRQK